MEMAAKTWSGEWWKLGGGGTAWDSIAYDPKLGLVYIGTGNGSPIVQAASQPGRRRQPLPLLHRRGRREDRRIPLALPGNARRGMGLHVHEVHRARATLPINGKQRDVLDARAEERLLTCSTARPASCSSAEKYTAVNWASHIDIEDRQAGRSTRRRVTAPILRSSTPGPGGGHNWFPMAYSPDTKLAYFPAYEQLVRLRDGSELQTEDVPLERRLGRLHRRER